MTKQKKWFATYTYFVVAYTIAVILFGAFVRATGAGAGCGAHWPTCNGTIIPQPEQIETIIEFSHRITSAFLGVLIIIMLCWGFWLYPKRHSVRRGAVWSLIFVIIEGGIGAGLVLFELVAYNQSVARTISIAAHLINTLILLMVLALTAWWASGKPAIAVRRQGIVSWLLAGGFLLLLFIGASGAITALGDTLFPAESLAEGIQQDLSPTAHFLIRLRIWHPAIAVITGLYLIWASTIIAQKRPSSDTIFFSRALRLLFVLQLGVGTLNLFLLAPVWMQLVHLLMADAVWLCQVLLMAAALALPQDAQAGSQTAVLTPAASP